MISSVAIAASRNYGQNYGDADAMGKVIAFVTTAKVAAADGLTVAEFSELTVALLRVAVSTVDSLDAAGDKKKEWVLESVSALFDAVADKMIPTLAWPVWIILKPAARSLVLLAASGAIEAILPLLRGK